MFCAVSNPIPEHDVSHWNAKKKAAEEGDSQVLLDSLDIDGMNK
jgi:hypothetical protein